MAFIGIRNWKNGLYAAVCGVMSVAAPFLAPVAEAGAPPPPIASTPCDSLYYQTLSARAWLEAQREITQNQNLILKADSVFEYTCFDMFLMELADHADEMFSETSQFGSPLSTTSMDNALERLVGTSLRNFVSANFGHGMLGGHAAGASITHNIANPINGGTYTCDIMRRVWEAAKCINFASNPAEDGFYTFQEYSTALDKRYLPTRCTGILPTWVANITTAYNTPPWAPDPMQTYLPYVDPANCVVGNANNIAIPTGVVVTRNNATPTTYNEHVCIIPGCRYDANNNRCEPN